MASNLLLYQLGMVALLLLCLLIYIWCPDHPSATPATSLKPTKP
jgi:hypothetical protein